MYLCVCVCFGRFHHNAFFAARALHVADLLNSSLIYPVFERIFEQQVQHLVEIALCDSFVKRFCKSCSLGDWLNLISDSLLRLGEERDYSGASVQ